jgi:putative glutamine amidotransferase
MNILIIPKIIEPYKNQLEFSIETKLLSFLKKCFNNCNINISYNFKFNKKYNLIILSGGNTVIQFSKKKNDKFRNKLDEYFFRKANFNKIPIIGICHGGHFLAIKYKLSLIKDAKHVGTHKLENLSKIQAKFRTTKSYHNYKIKFKESHKIENLFLADDKSIECFKVKNKKIGGVIWHPEREIKNIKKQIDFFKNFYSFILK